MGTVWQAKHLTLHSLVAVKMMHPSIGFSKTGLQRFMLEARAAAGMRSPHVVQVLDHGVDAGTPYIVMELLEGETLAARLRRVRRLSPRDTALFITHVARALSKAERVGITHRDLKPDNVFLIQNEDEEIAKVLDFGVAKVDSPTFGSFGEGGEPTAAGALLGTPYYASPEQADGLKSIDHRTDIWSLSVMTYECLLGRRPFDGTSLPKLLMAICKDPLPVPSQHGDVPAGFDAWFARACSRRIEGRFESARAAATELSRLCDAGELTSADWTIRRAPEARPFDVPKLQVPGSDDDDEDDGAPTEIWRGKTSDDLDDLPLPPRRPSAMPAPAPLQAPTPLVVLPMGATVRTPPLADSRAASTSALVATARRPSSSSNASRRSQVAALAGLAMLSSSVGFWFASRPAQTSAAAMSAAVAGAKPPPVAEQPRSVTPMPSPTPVASASSDGMPTVDLNQLPTLPKRRGIAPQPKAPSPSPAAPPGEDIPNPYR
jgi:serine/threonine protein kinase